NGQAELIEAVTGLRAATSGRVALGGRDVTRATPLERLRAGLAHVPADRLARGILAEYDLADNLILGRQRDRPFAKGAWVRPPPPPTPAAGAPRAPPAPPADSRGPGAHALGRQPAEARRGPRAVAAWHAARGRAPDARRRPRRHRVHPSPPDRRARSRRRRAAR